MVLGWRGADRTVMMGSEVSMRRRFIVERMVGCLGRRKMS